VVKCQHQFHVTNNVQIHIDTNTQEETHTLRVLSCICTRCGMKLTLDKSRPINNDAGALIALPMKDSGGDRFTPTTTTPNPTTYIVTQ